MKKHKETSLPKISADKIAAQLKKGVGLDRARRIADHYAKTVGLHPKTNDLLVSFDDVNSEFFRMKDLVKNARIWMQVRNILANQKGFTLFELVFCLAILGVVAVGIVEIGVIVHFVRKLW